MENLVSSYIDHIHQNIQKSNLKGNFWINFSVLKTQSYFMLYFFTYYSNKLFAVHLQFQFIMNNSRTERWTSPGSVHIGPDMEVASDIQPSHSKIRTLKDW